MEKAYPGVLKLEGVQGWRTRNQMSKRWPLISRSATRRLAELASYAI